MGNKKEKLIRIKLHTYARNGSDGSVSVRLFADARLAERAAERDDERYQEDLEEHVLLIDPATGTIVSGVETELDEDDE